MVMKDVITLISSIILSGTGIWATIYFSRAGKTREDDKMMKELFKDFNERYDELNDKLYLIVEPRTDSDAMKSILMEGFEKKSVIIDYFNLCAEEYFWYKKGRIDEKVWLSWSTGMNYWYNHSSGKIKEVWKEEIEQRNGTKSYYIVNGDEFFKEKIDG